MDKAAFSDSYNLAFGIFVFCCLVSPVMAFSCQILCSYLVFSKIVAWKGKSLWFSNAPGEHRGDRRCFTRGSNCDLAKGCQVLLNHSSTWWPLGWWLWRSYVSHARVGEFLGSFMPISYYIPPWDIFCLSELSVFYSIYSRLFFLLYI